MAKKIEAYIKLQVPAGQANPSPPVGPALGQSMALTSWSSVKPSMRRLKALRTRYASSGGDYGV